MSRRSYDNYNKTDQVREVSISGELTKAPKKY